MRKVLIVTRDFPPNDCVDGWFIRSYSLARFLKEHHFGIYVVCSRKERKTNKYDVRGIMIYEQPTFRYSDLLVCNRNPLRIPRQVISFLLHKYRKTELIDWAEPVLDKFYNACERLVLEKGIRNIIVTTPPHSLQLVGLRLKRRFGTKVRWLADFRDPWTLRKKYQRENKRVQQRIELLERKCFQKSDVSIVVSNGMLSMYAKVVDTSKTIVVENGYNEVLCRHADKSVVEFADYSRKQKRVVLGYFGVGGTGRRNDGKSFDNLFAAFDEDRPLSERFSLLIQGRFDLERTPPAGLMVKVLPPCNNDIARANMKNIDIGLFVYDIATDAAAVMGGKVYDYIGSDVAIWFLVPQGADAIEGFVSRTKYCFTADIDCRQDIKDVAKCIVNEYDEGTLKNRKLEVAIKYRYSRKYQFNKILQLMD